ncbi:HEAT repeat domain-containing protein [Desulfofustis limnaeus]|jgi:hypothetical protein|uniref:HEAT repeat domain-containing protein n=1 Tax=Desulfofustis limnaeus TaxID=2740163 RepID=A0ABN6MD82_9BACT|nr:HEAT repeat domain-containing protein [Desulfofustis limnaeus]MDX9894141.1 HEAT repeat domain-containing protein [Desulfofustis sp.]BDD89447.1 hypothetical protein DPPLL_38120 [Desulfofustis limnaeus]
MDGELNDPELLQVVKDFLELGHADTIAIMVHRGAWPLEWTGQILDDERFNVRLGVSVLFEELRTRMPGQLNRAIPSLLPLLTSPQPHLRGDAISVLAIIGTPEALDHIRPMADDPHPQVREIVADILHQTTVGRVAPIS